MRRIAIIKGNHMAKLVDGNWSFYVREDSRAAWIQLEGESRKAGIRLFWDNMVAVQKELDSR